MADFHPHFDGFGTDAVHAGQEPEQWNSWAVNPPISLSTTFKQPTPGVTKSGFEYSRGGNPTRKCLETAFAALSKGKHAFVWASGLAGTQATLQLLKNGDHILAIDDLYGGTGRLLRRICEPLGITADFVDTSDPVKFAESIKDNTKMVWFETPTNPLLKVTDIKAVCAAVRAKREDIIIVVDNTFMSPYFQRPLTLGADIEFASVTKYLNGHSDVLMGVTICKDDKLAERLQFIQFAAGAVPGPFDCYMVNRGLKTLHLRMEMHSRNAMAVARFLEANPKVEEVIYPGLESHPGHAIAKSQNTGFSGMVTFRIKGGLDEAKKFLENIKVFTLAESLGAVESLAELPAIMTHASVPADHRAAIGITDNLLRLSVGVEDTHDLLADLKQAIDLAVAGEDQAPNVDDFVHVQAAHLPKYAAQVAEQIQAKLAK